jgi:uncharacterized protein (DUF1499 family)
MTEDTPQGPGKITLWITRIAAALGIGAPVVAVLLALATGMNLVGYEISLGALRYLVFAAGGGVGLALIGLAIVALKRHWGLLKWLLPTIIVAAGFVFYLMAQLDKATSVPPIHDITTDLSNPPQFETLSLRSDNRAVVPDGGRADLAAVDNAMRWRLWHSEGYADIQPISVSGSVPDTVAVAERLVADRGWELAASDAATGRLEATDTVSLYRFKDDIVLRITPDPNGDGSIVHMRSVSRVGVSDLGVNANRIRSFLADLAAATQD